MNNPDFRLFGHGASFQVDDITCFCVNLINLDDVLAQFVDLESFGIEDYEICTSQKTLYSNLGDDSKIFIDDFPPQIFSGRQYIPNIWENKNGSYLSVLCTYAREDYWVVV